MRIRSALVYTVLRLLAFLVPFGIMMLFPVFQELYWLAAIFAAVIGVCLSMIFLRRPLNHLSAGLAERRAAHPSHRPPKASDEDIEDAEDDASHVETTTDATARDVRTDAGPTT